MATKGRLKAGEAPEDGAAEVEPDAALTAAPLIVEGMAVLLNEPVTCVSARI